MQPQACSCQAQTSLSPWFPGIRHPQLTIRAAEELRLPGLSASEVLGPFFCKRNSHWPSAFLSLIAMALSRGILGWSDLFTPTFTTYPPTNLAVWWKSNVPACHLLLVSLLLVWMHSNHLPQYFSTSGLNLGEQLNSNSLNLFWGPQNLLLKLRVKPYASLKWVRIFCDCVLWFQLVLQLSLCPSFVLNFSWCHAQLRWIRTLKWNSTPYEPLLSTNCYPVPFCFGYSLPHLIFSPVKLSSSHCSFPHSTSNQSFPGHLEVSARLFPPDPHLSVVVLSALLHLYESNTKARSSVLQEWVCAAGLPAASVSWVQQ